MTTQQDPAPLTVLYDGACPLCRREIGVYQGLTPTAPVCYTDVSDATQALPTGTTQAQLMARFHVRRPDGELLSGAQAFLALWAALPGWRWLARLGRLPGAAWLMERAYVGFLRWRPHLQRWALRVESAPRPGRRPARPPRESRKPAAAWRDLETRPALDNASRRHAAMPDPTPIAADRPHADPAARARP